MLTLHSLLLIFVFSALSKGCKQCDSGVKKENCLVDPCKGMTCENAVCKSNYCGGCNRLWYNSEGKDITKKCDFKCPPADQCLPTSKVFVCDKDPCKGATCKGYPEATCCTHNCGGCLALWFNYGDWVLCQ